MLFRRPIPRTPRRLVGGFPSQSAKLTFILYHNLRKEDGNAPQAVTGAYWYSVSREMPNSRASPARFSPAATRARSYVTRSGARRLAASVDARFLRYSDSLTLTFLE